MKSTIRFAIIGALMAAALVSVSAAPAGKGVATAPGQADNFYRGITTLDPVVTTELVSSTSEVISSSTVTSDPVITQNTTSAVVDTRVIGQGNGNPTGNLQDKVATTTTTESTAIATTTSVVETTNVYAVTTTIGSHHGAPISNGKALEPVVTTATDTQVSQDTQVSTAEVTSTSTETVVGDWQAAYSVPSGTK